MIRNSPGRLTSFLACGIALIGSSITSYINNLHPEENVPLYKVIENIIDASIPLWDLSLTALEYEVGLPIGRIEEPRDYEYTYPEGYEPRGENGATNGLTGTENTGS